MSLRTPGFVAALGIVFMGLCAASEPVLQVLDRVILPKELRIEGRKVGGLSGLAYEPQTGLLWAVSDGRQWAGSTVFQFRLQMEGEKMRITPERILKLQSPGGARDPLDAEGIALWSRNRLFISHEGSKRGGVAPGIACFSGRSGKPLFGVPIPSEFLPDATEPHRGLQENRGFESLALSRPRAMYLFTANESPLLQDLANPRDPASGPVRILRYRLGNLREAPVQRAYIADRDAVFGSVVDLIAVPSGSKLLVLERQLLWPIGPRQRRIRIYEVDFADPAASEISGLPSLRGKQIRPLGKTLVFDSSMHPLPQLDNIEGMTWGPIVNGSPTILLVSDDNFSASQQTEFVLLGVRGATGR